MTSARDEVLRRIRAALRDVPADERPDAIAVARDYHTRDETPAEELLQRFAERVAEYKAAVRVVSEVELAPAIAEELRSRGARRLVVPADAPEAWLPAGVAALRDDGQLSHAELDACDGVLTGCALGIAQTGTIVLDHGERQGRRAISLLPDYHLCLVWSDQIVGMVPETLARLNGAAEQRRPLTFISGPSATSDIELNRVEGVHGPRTLAVLIVRSADTIRNNERDVLAQRA
jgi:L-lactate dehydrogenase complex protein LldG